MNWTDEEIEAEIARQKEAQLDKDVLDAQAAVYFGEQKEWHFVEYTDGGHHYSWVHNCGAVYYQLDKPTACYLGCEEDV